MSDKNVDQIKALYTELSKIAPSQDWEKILKVSKKSTIILYLYFWNNISELHTYKFNLSSIGSIRDREKSLSFKDSMPDSHG